MPYFQPDIDTWNPPGHWLKITTIDAHTGGEPLRVFISGYPEIKGDTILSRRRYMRENLDHIRTALMWEPRGHADMYGCVLYPPVSPGADFGIMFLHNEGYSTMCGHAIIAITKVVLETGMFPMRIPETVLKIDTPAGLVTSHARIADGKVTGVYFHNVPAFVLALDETVDVEGIGAVRYDIAFGGAFYAFVKAEDAGVRCTPDCFRQLIEKGMAIKHAVMKRRPVVHPFEQDLNFLYGVIFIGPPLSKEADSRNVCIFAEGEVDRSPTGTGVSARMALHHAKREIRIGEAMTIESIVGSTMKGRVAATTTFGPHKAVIPEVEGTAFITGTHTFYLDPDDPFRYGFILR